MTVQEWPGGRASRVLMWLGHYVRVFLAVSFLLAIINDILGGKNGLLPVNILSAVAIGVFLVALFADSHWHQENLCVRCIAATPLDPQAAVDRWRRALRANHSGAAWAFLVIAALAGLIGTTSVLSRPWSVVVIAAAWVMFAVFNLAVHIHRRLYPWCPWCDWGDGGGDEEVSPDVPDPAISQ
jgi:hypothetical protein